MSESGQLRTPAATLSFVRFWGQSGSRFRAAEGPLIAKRRHSALQQSASNLVSEDSVSDFDYENELRWPSPNVRVGSTTEVQPGPRNVRCWRSSGSRSDRTSGWSGLGRRRNRLASARKRLYSAHLAFGRPKLPPRGRRGLCGAFHRPNPGGGVMVTMTASGA